MISPAPRILLASANGSIRPPCAWVRTALSILILASPVMLLGQFQEPTSDELKMTADPKAPGASAICLYREESTDNSNRTFVLYERIKILTEKVKNWQLLAFLTSPVSTASLRSMAAPSMRMEPWFP